MERILKVLDENATEKAPKTGRTRRILSGVALSALGILILGAAIWAMTDRALYYSGLHKLIGLVGMVPLMLGLDRISPGLSRRLMGISGKGKARR